MSQLPPGIRRLARGAGARLRARLSANPSPNGVSPTGALIPQPHIVTGGTAAAGIEAPRTTWYFAEGYTAPGFDVYLAILNPHDRAATITITYYLATTEPVARTLFAPARRRTTVAVHDPTLGVGRGHAVSIKVESTNGVGIVVERTTYFTYGLEPRELPLSGAELAPAEERIFVGKGDFAAIGNWTVCTFIERCGLRVDERVLDIGCGIGRIAATLTQYLSPEGSYEGFDIVAHGIEWCRAEITPRYPNFRFQHADIFNAEYNPGGRLQPSEYTFPYADADFDFAFATSVFTHMLPADVDHYLAEVARVLRPGGRSFLTFFVVPDDGQFTAVPSPTGDLLDFRYDQGEYLTIDPTTPERAVAYREGWLRAAFARHGLRIVQPIAYGTWCGTPGGLTYQDCVIAVREEAQP